ncbi:MAG TPA: hypothetical protein VGU73_01280, partial [Acidimicrobiia bacterium]|nr:hypothetical protein [Acidimicrobiia bacterium]
LALLQWIRYNVFLDLIEHGIGNGIFDPFGGTATVTNGVVTFTPSSPAFTPATPAGTPPAVDPTNPVVLATGFTPTPAADPCDTFPPGPSDTIAIGDECAVNFTLNVTGATAVLFLLPADLAPNQLAEILDVTLGNATVVPNVAYGAQDTFQLVALDIGTTNDIGTTSFQYTAVGPGGVSTSKPVQVDIRCDTDDACAGAAGASTPTTPTPPAASSSATSGSAPVSSPPVSSTPTGSTPSTTSPTTSSPANTSTPTTASTSS